MAVGSTAGKILKVILAGIGIKIAKNAAGAKSKGKNVNNPVATHQRKNTDLKVTGSP